MRFVLVARGHQRHRPMSAMCLVEANARHACPKGRYAPPAFGRDTGVDRDFPPLAQSSRQRSHQCGIAGRQPSPSAVAYGRGASSGSSGAVRRRSPRLARQRAHAH